MNPVPRLAGLTILALVACLLAACTSAEELMEDGAELEAEGRYEEAARKYIAAYDKDPSIVDLDVKATSLGNRVVDDLLFEAQTASGSDRPVQSAETYMKIDDLVLKALEAGLHLDRPSDYGDLRFDTFRDAVAVLIDDAIEAFDRGDVNRADEIIRDALRRFDPTAEETEVLLQVHYDVLLAWADRATNLGRFREAIAKADEALAVAEEGSFPPDPAIALRTRAIDLGTLYVAAAPARTWGRDRDAVSPWLIAEVNDRLELNYWSSPPELVAMAHSALVRQRIRQLGFGRGPLSRRDARMLAADLDADFVVLPEVERFEWTERNVRDRPKQARTHSGKEVVYSEIRGKIEYEARVRLMIVSRSGDVLVDDHFQDRRSRDFKRAEYDGDYRDLDLSSSDRKLFRRDHLDDLLSEVENDLIDRVTQRIAERAYDRLGHEVR